MDNRICFLIDDDPDDREIFNIALSEIGPEFKCITAKNAVEALEMIDNGPGFVPDYIFLDLNMPLLSGLQCLDELKKRKQLSNVNILIYSTSSFERDFEEAKRIGASHFFVKPSSISTLISTLEEVFRGEDLPFLLIGE